MVRRVATASPNARRPIRAAVCPLKPIATQPRVPRDEGGERVGGRRANGAIQAPRARRLGDDIPQRDSARRQTRQPPLIVEPRQILPDRLPEQAPELILRMRIIALRRERRLPR